MTGCNAIAKPVDLTWCTAKELTSLDYGLTAGHMQKGLYVNENRPNTYSLLTVRLTSNSCQMLVLVIIWSPKNLVGPRSSVWPQVTPEFTIRAYGEIAVYTTTFSLITLDNGPQGHCKACWLDLVHSEKIDLIGLQIDLRSHAKRVLF